MKNISRLNMVNLKEIERPSRSKGFTIVELLIATTVFSTILLISLTGFLQIGQIFYKGVTVTRTQESARQAMDSLAADVRFASSISQSTALPAGGSGNAANAEYFCAGKNRYTFNRGQILDTNAETQEMNNSAIPKTQWQRFGLLKDTLDVADSCAKPLGSGAVAFKDNVVELLGNKMRVGNLAITQLSGVSFSNLYTLNVRIAYGDDNILQNPSATNVSCDSSLSTSQYCYVSDLKTTVRRGF